MFKIKTLMIRLQTYVNEHNDIFKNYGLVLYYNISEIFTWFKKNIFDLIISAYFAAYYTIFGSIFCGSNVHINPFPNHYIYVNNIIVVYYKMQLNPYIECSQTN
jgi:hypothetical protein